MGPETISNVYVAELRGLQLATTWLKKYGLEDAKKAGQVHVFSDSQAALKAMRAPRMSSGQQILALLLQEIKALRKEGVEAHYHWIPGHEGVRGNERADQAAKEAAESQKQTSGLIALASAAKQTARQLTKEKWKKQWKQQPTLAKPTKHLIPEPTKATLKLYKGLTKPQSSALIQLRTGRIGLNHFLYKIKARDSDRCGCDRGSQTPRHILFDCMRLRGLQLELRQRLRGQRIAVNWDDFDALVSEPAAARHVAEFMLKTGLLEQFREVPLTNDTE